MATSSFINFSAQDFFDILMPELPGVYQAVVLQELDRTLRDYFRRTGAWQERLVPSTSFAVGQVRVDLNEELERFSAPYKVANVYAVWDDKTELPQQALVRSLKEDTRSSQRRWHCPQRSVVEFSGTAWSVAKDLEYQVALYPAERGVAYPQWIWDDHSEAIRYGVLGRMMSQSRKPYSNPVDGRTFTNAYFSEINSAKAEADRGNTPAGQTWHFPRSFA